MDTISLKERLHIPKYDDAEQIEPGIVVFDQKKCTCCFQCKAVCPARAIIKKDGRPAIATLNECVYCGDCEAICPEDAVKIKKPNRLSGYLPSSCSKTFRAAGKFSVRR